MASLGLLGGLGGLGRGVSQVGRRQFDANLEAQREERIQEYKIAAENRASQRQIATEGRASQRQIATEGRAATAQEKRDQRLHKNQVERLREGGVITRKNAGYSSGLQTARDKQLHQNRLGQLQEGGAIARENADYSSVIRRSDARAAQRLKDMAGEKERTRRQGLLSSAGGDYEAGEKAAFDAGDVKLAQEIKTLRTAANNARLNPQTKAYVDVLQSELDALVEEGLYSDVQKQRASDLRQQILDAIGYAPSAPAGVAPPPTVESGGRGVPPNVSGGKAPFRGKDGKMYIVRNGQVERFNKTAPKQGFTTNDPADQF
jgi:hypothetical protein